MKKFIALAALFLCPLVADAHGRSNFRFSLGFRQPIIIQQQRFVQPIYRQPIIIQQQRFVQPIYQQRFIQQEVVDPCQTQGLYSGYSSFRSFSFGY